MAPEDTTQADETLDDGRPSQPQSVSIALDGVGDKAFSDRYQTLRRLGRGGMGDVNLSHDRQIGRQVAIKSLLAEHADRPYAQRRFLREARVQGQLEHPAVVPVYDLGVDPDGELYFTMKRVRGETLEEIVAGLRDGVPGFEDRYPRHRLLAAFTSVCLAVDYAHGRGVLHRDLKPANVMLGDYGEVYVLDWGLARIAGSPEDGGADGEVDAEPSGQTRVGALLGTPGYMSPEQARGKHDDLTPASDVYALGCMLYELLTHEPLNPASSTMEALAATLAGVDARASVRAPQALVPHELERICLRATALRPKDRYPSARALHDALDRFLAGQRDAILRSEMADTHARRAADAVVGSGTGQEDTIEVRRGAMKDIGRALALDPGNTRAMQALQRLLTEPPSTLPPEVLLEMRRAKHDRVRWAAGVGMWVYGGLILYLPVLLWAGVDEWPPLVAFYVLAAACSALSGFVSRQRHPSDAIVLVVLILSNAMVASLWWFFGPLIVLPTVMVGNTIGFTLQLEGRMRLVSVVAGCLCIVVPFLLEATGLIAPTFHFESGQLVLHVGALGSHGGLLLFVASVSVAAVLTTAIAMSRVRDALAAAEKRLYLYTWHLREVVPEEVRGSTDPTVARGA